MTIQVIDAMMGARKSTTLFAKMRSGEIAEPILYVTPFLDEVNTRPMQEAPELSFVSPEGKTQSKTKDIKPMLMNGENVSCSHQLLRNFDEEVLEALEAQGYTIVIDEALSVFEQPNIEAPDVAMLIDSGVMKVDEETGQVEWMKPNYRGKFSDVKHYAETGVLFLTPRFKMLAWEFPVGIFELGLDIWVATYLFDSSMMAMYLKAHAYPYTILDNHELGLIPEGILKAQAKSLLEIYEGKHNDIGENQNTKRRNKPLNDTMLSTGNLKYKANRDSLVKAIRAVVRTEWEAKANDVLITYHSSVKTAPKGLAKRVQPCNLKATNEFSNVSHVVYGMNLRLSNDFIDFLEDRTGVDFDANGWALSEMIQFLWRGCIRKGEPMKVYVPSVRMRTLLINWLND